MKRFRNILYVLDASSTNSENIDKKVRYLAEINDACVSIVYVAEDDFHAQFGRKRTQRIDELAAAMTAAAQEKLETCLTREIWNNVIVSGELLSGKGFISIIRKVIRDNHDLVIKGRCVSNTVDELALKLFRKCPCPVWVIDDAEEVASPTILAALDVGNDHEETVQLNKNIAELAYSLAQMKGGQVHYLHAWRLQYEMILHGPRFNVHPDEIIDLQGKIGASREKALIELLVSMELPVVQGTVHIVEGVVSDMIEETVNELNIDTLVMGTVGRSGVPGLLIGNTAEKILPELRCKVLAVKPDGFVSPVSV
jgi:nucleotide-binding universal stress UspA family protein